MWFEQNEIFCQQDVAQSRTAHNVLDILNTDFHDGAISKRSLTLDWGRHGKLSSIVISTNAHAICKIRTDYLYT
jgi:hypothetical protein